MTVELDLRNLLQDLVGNRMFPDVAPPTTATPRITYQQVGGESVQFIDRTLPSRKNGRFQINVWATTRQEAAALSIDIENRMLLATVFQTSPLGAPVAVFEPDTRLYSTRQDWSIWSVR